MKKLGLEDAIKTRDLGELRKFFAKQRPEEYLTKVFKLANVKYAVMTNIPFNEEEASHWRPEKKPIPPELKPALRVDPLLNGDWKTVESALKAANYPATLEGTRQYLRDWVKTMEPIYLMASTPADFKYPAEKGTNQHTPGASDLLEGVLLPLAEELNLGLALKIGAERGVNPDLRGGGDGVVVADCSIIKRLCQNFPKVKFLVTFLSRVNQQEICVLAQKFRNLHLYGCWWYCNNPSIIKEITQFRFELLGTAFTAQHSDARVLDQLIYKWDHSRKIIGDVMVAEYVKLAETGWVISKEEIYRDVWTIFGGEFEHFIGLNK